MAGGSLFSELKRRNVFRVGAAYLVGSWLLIQVVETIAPLFGLGDGPAKITVVVLAIGFVPVLILSWVFEWTPEGFQREEDVSAETRRTNKDSLHRAITVLLVLAVVYFAADKFWFRAAPVALEQSIAVMSFVNTSTDPDKEYFSAGVSDALLNLLARIEGLRVIARPSIVALESAGLGVAEIAQQLNVRHVLQGTVWWAGDRIRISVQLTDMSDDEHLWSDSYERQFENIFSIQDEVAARVIEELKLAIDVGLEPIDRHNPEAYALYLRADQLLKTNDPSFINTAEDLLEQALELEPGYVDAMFNLHLVYVRKLRVLERGGDRDAVMDYRDRRVRMMKEMERLAPDHAKTNANLAWEAIERTGDYAAAARHIEKAIEAEPRHYDTLLPATRLAMELGRPDIAIAIGEFLASRDPLAYWAHTLLGNAYLQSGRFEDAVRAYRTAASITPNSPAINSSLGFALLLDGKPEVAVEAFDKTPVALAREHGRAMALSDLGDSAGAAAAQDAFKNLATEESAPIEYAQLYAWTGDPDAAFRILYAIRDAFPDGTHDFIFDPILQRLSTDPRWQPLVDEYSPMTAGVRFNPKFPSEILAALESATERQPDAQ